MTSGLDTATFAALLLGWFGFLAIFAVDRLRRSRRESARDATVRRAPSALWGIALQGVGFALVWAVRRPVPAADPAEWPKASAVELSALRFALVTLLAAGSCALVLAAVRTLGKQWALAARVLDDHELVRSGPFRIVRHPIYLGMGGLLVATGLALAPAWALAAAAALYLAGTRLRVAAEERLLAERFGPAFADFRAAVPAFLPSRSPAIPTPSLALAGFASAAFALTSAALAAVGRLTGRFHLGFSVWVSFVGWETNAWEPPSWTGAALTATACSAVFAVFAVYAFAGSGLLARRPPFLRAGLVASAAVYLLAALDPLSLYGSYKTLGWTQEGLPGVHGHSLAFAIVGLLYLLGTIAAGRRATP